MTRLLSALALLAAGCAAPSPVSAPAPPDAAPTLGVLALGALPPAPQPDLPTPLRRDVLPPGPGSMGHSAMNHGEMDHGMAPAAPTARSAALDAYLALHDALASDDAAAAAAPARAFETAFATLTEQAPDDDLHFWHMRGAPTAAVRTAAASLVQANTLAQARTAFSELSPPFADLVEAMGTPAGYDLRRYVCGMTDAPGGGVWLQRDGTLRNPYLGTAMRACGTRTGGLSPTEPPVEMRTDEIRPKAMPIDHSDH